MRPAAEEVPVETLSRLLKALADETRLRIVALLSHGELCVCHIHAALGISQPNASRHLAILRSSGVVETRRDGNWVHYRLVRQADGDCDRLLRTVMKTFAQRDLLRKDVERLLKVRGPNACK